MRKVLVVLLALLAIGCFAFAAPAKSSSSDSGSLFAPGDFSVLAGVGTGFFLGIDVYGGAELDFGQFTIANVLPVTWGAGARVGYYGWSSYSDISIGAMAMAHVDFGAFAPSMTWLQKFDWYIGLGLGTYVYTYGTSTFNFGFASVGGVNWFISKNFAINFEGGYYGYGGDGRIGVLFKI